MSSFAAQTMLILRHDLRMLWRDWMSSRWKDYLSVALIVVLFCIANAIAIGIFFAVRRAPPPGYETMAWLFFGFIMLGAAMNQAIATLFERADFDLLLPSPVSPRAILLARMSGMMLGAALSVAIFLLPIVNGAILAVSWRYAAGYLVWLLLSASVASAGVWFTLVLVQWLGPRRARIWAQVSAAVLGASVYLIIQTRQFMREEASAQFSAQLSALLAEPPFVWLALAGRGEPLPLLALTAIAVASVSATGLLLGRIFVGGLQEAGAIAVKRKPRRERRRHVFTEGIARATFWKDLRLIARDPLLLARVLPPALYILPPLVGASRFGGAAVIAPLTLFLTGQFSLSLSSVAASGEDCWDLIRMSPTPELRLRIAKLAAGMALPAVLCVVLCVVLAVLGRPWLALLTLVFSLACAAACSWLHVAQVKPTPRNDIFKRKTSAGSLGRGIVAALVLMVGAAGLGFGAANYWIVASLLLGLTALAVAACFTFVRLEEIHLRDFSADGAGAA